MLSPKNKQQISNAFDVWLNEGDGDLDSFLFEYFDKLELYPLYQTRNIKFAFRMAKFFSPFAFKTNDKDYSTFWGYVKEIGQDYLAHCSSTDMRLMAKYLGLCIPEDYGYVLLRQEFDISLETAFLQV